jgi:hypothetical protein
VNRFTGAAVFAGGEKEKGFFFFAPCGPRRGRIPAESKDSGRTRIAAENLK